MCCEFDLDSRSRWMPTSVRIQTSGLGVMVLRGASRTTSEWPSVESHSLGTSRLLPRHGTTRNVRHTLRQRSTFSHPSLNRSRLEWQSRKRKNRSRRPDSRRSKPSFNDSMICYKDTTFCTGAGCVKFKNCPKALTERVLVEATKWWGGPEAPISRHSDPTQLSCYEGPSVRQFLKG
jgi:hypothetical protein